LPRSAPGPGDRLSVDHEWIDTNTAAGRTVFSMDWTLIVEPAINVGVIGRGDASMNEEFHMLPKDRWLGLHQDIHS
jgi:hypothetical protein